MFRRVVERAESHLESSSSCIEAATKRRQRLNSAYCGIHTFSVRHRRSRPIFFWKPHPTFDFWRHHIRRKHRDRTTPEPASFDASSYEVSLEPAENPRELSLVRRWLAVIYIASASICVTHARQWYIPAVYRHNTPSTNPSC
jgi:hypothetical protein